MVEKSAACGLEMSAKYYLCAIYSNPCSPTPTSGLVLPTWIFMPISHTSGLSLASCYLTPNLSTSKICPCENRTLSRYILLPGSNKIACIPTYLSRVQLSWLALLVWGLVLFSWALGMCSGFCSSAVVMGYLLK